MLFLASIMTGVLLITCYLFVRMVMYNEYIFYPDTLTKEEFFLQVGMIGVAFYIWVDVVTKLFGLS